MNETCIPCLPSHHAYVRRTHMYKCNVQTQEVAEMRRQIAMEQVHKRKKDTIVDGEEQPTEFECCFCTTKVENLLIYEWTHCLFIFDSECFSSYLF